MIFLSDPLSNAQKNILQNLLASEKGKTIFANSLYQPKFVEVILLR